MTLLDLIGFNQFESILLCIPAVLEPSLRQRCYWPSGRVENPRPEGIRIARTARPQSLGSETPAVALEWRARWPIGCV